MKTKTKYLVYPFAVIAISLFVIVGCSDEEEETTPANDIIHGVGVTDIDDNFYTTVIIGSKMFH